eukprot:g4259.t1
MSEATITLSKFISNPLLSRKQAVVTVVHPNKANVSKKDIQSMIAKHLKKVSADNVVVFGMRTKFGGGKSTGFALMYDSKEDLLKFEPKYRLLRRDPEAFKVTRNSKKARAEEKRRGKKVRGTGVRLAKKKAKRNQE